MTPPAPVVIVSLENENHPFPVNRSQFGRAESEQMTIFLSGISG
jgi:hypothetical protein